MKTQLQQININRINVLKAGFILVILLSFLLSGFPQSGGKIKATFPIIRIAGTYTQSTNGYTDETVVFFDSIASYSFNPKTDAHKLMNTEPTIPNIYTVKDNQNLAINGLPAISDTLVVPVGYNVSLPGTYTINLSQIQNIDTAKVRIYLIDLALNVEQDVVTNPEYMFTINPSDKGGRFFLKFKTEGSGDATSVGKISNKDFSSIYSSGSNLYVNNNFSNLYEKSVVTVMDLTGQKIFEAKGVSNGNHKYILNETPGLYIVKVLSRNSVKTQKVYIY